MRPLSILLLAGALCSPAAWAVDREFKDVVRAISDEFHTRPMHIPLFGLVNMVTSVAHPAGVTHIRLATFENLKPRDGGPDLSVVVRAAVGRSWTPFVQVHSRRKGREETVLVYLRSEGSDCRLLVTSIESTEATVVELKLNPEGLSRWISLPRESAHSSPGGPEL
jgi:hypothetical protein